MSPKHRDTQDQPPRLGTHRKRAGYTLGSRHNPGGGAGGEEQELLFSLTSRMNTGQALDGCRERFRHVDRHCLLVPASRARMEGTVRRLGTGDGSRALEIGGVGKRHRMRWCKRRTHPDGKYELRERRHNHPPSGAEGFSKYHGSFNSACEILASLDPGASRVQTSTDCHNGGLDPTAREVLSAEDGGRCRGQIGNHRAPGT